MITVYGADWCEDTRRSQRLLRRLHVPHHYINIDEDLDGARARQGAQPRAAAHADHRSRPRRPAARRAGQRHAGGGAGRARDADAGRGARAARHPERRRRRARGAHDGRAGPGRRAPAPSPPSLRWPLRLLGLVAAATGVSGWCPAYHAAGVTSLGGRAIGRTKRSAPSGSCRKPRVGGDAGATEATRHDPAASRADRLRRARRRPATPIRSRCSGRTRPIAAW